MGTMSHDSLLWIALSAASFAVAMLLYAGAICQNRKSIWPLLWKILMLVGLFKSLSGSPRDALVLFGIFSVLATLFLAAGGLAWAKRLGYTRSRGS